MPTKITLTKPINSYGKEITELEFHEPNGQDVRIAGVPYRIDTLADGTERSDYNTAAAATLISRLANIPPSSVDQMAASDFVAAMNLVLSFFGAASPEKSSTATSSLQGSSAATGSGA
jgi:hypothetical protein